MDRGEPKLMEKTRVFFTEKIAYLELFFVFLLFSLFSIVVLYKANPYLFEPGRDGGFFMYVGRMMLAGKRLYIDLWDQKGPIIFFLNAIGIFLGRNTRWGVWGLEFIFLLGSSVIAFYVIKRRYGILPAVFGVSAGLWGTKYVIGSGNYTEEYSLLFTWISIFAFSQSLYYNERNRYPFIMGMMLALNFLLRVNNIGTTSLLLFIWFLFTWVNRGIVPALKKSIFLVAGILLVLIPFFIYFAAKGNFDEMISASILYGLDYSFETRQDSSFLSYTNIIKGSLLPGFKALKVLAYLPLLGFLIAIKLTISQIKSKNFDYFVFALVLIWPVEVLASSISGRGYGHYFICWIPAITLLSALLFDYLNRYILRPDFVDSYNKRNPLATIAFYIILLIIVFPDELNMNFKSFNRTIFYRSEGIEYVSPISDYIRNNTNINDLVLVWGGQAGINVMGHRPSIDAYMFYPTIANTDEGLKLQKLYFETLSQQKPTLIIDGSINSPETIPAIDPIKRSKKKILHPLAANTQETLDYILTNYEFETEVSGYDIYRIK